MTMAIATKFLEAQLPLSAEKQVEVVNHAMAAQMSATEFGRYPPAPEGRAQRPSRKRHADPKPEGRLRSVAAPVSRVRRRARATDRSPAYRAPTCPRAEEEGREARRDRGERRMRVPSMVRSSRLRRVPDFRNRSSSEDTRRGFTALGWGPSEPFASRLALLEEHRSRNRRADGHLGDPGFVGWLQGSWTPRAPDSAASRSWCSLANPSTADFRRPGVGLLRARRLLHRWGPARAVVLVGRTARGAFGCPDPSIGRRSARCSKAGFPTVRSSNTVRVSTDPVWTSRSARRRASASPRWSVGMSGS